MNLTNYTAHEIIKQHTANREFNKAIEFYEQISEYITDMNIMNEYGAALFFTGRFTESMDIYTEILYKCPNIGLEFHNHLISNMRFSVQKLLTLPDDDVPYNKQIVEMLMNRDIDQAQKWSVSFSVTTCKRLRLFIKTMNSFMNCCTDINKISEFICVDDQSNDDDIKCMARLYPFLTIIRKPFEKKGHAPSMNIIAAHVKTAYVFHIEDDWEFVIRRRYITDMIKVLQDNPIYGQCVANKNYAENFDLHDILDGEYKISAAGVQYFKHIQEHDFKEPCKNVRYWPHFSLNPSIIRTEVFNRVGEFKKEPHFEFHYGYRYVAAGYQTVFLSNIHCSHIGRPNEKRDDKTTMNAYDLNDEHQF